MRSLRVRQCDRCQQISSVLYRVQYDDSGQWQLICQDCWAIVSPDNPQYVYGGTWKARKKR